MIAWLRERAPHRAQRISAIFNRRGDEDSSKEWSGWRVGNLRPTFEPILWFVKPYKIGATITDNVLTYGVGAFNDSAFLKYNDLTENVLKSHFLPNESGKHPTQKPITLLKALIELTTLKNQLVVDPFCGSGSTLLAAKILERNYLGFEISKEYFETTMRRLDEKPILSKKKSNQFSLI